MTEETHEFPDHDPASANPPSPVPSFPHAGSHTPNGATGHGGKPTIRDVARLAGISYGTVSRYLNGGARVSKQTSDRIARAIETIHYTPNNAARSLARRCTHLVSMIVQVQSDRTIAQDSVSEALAAANRVLGDAGYQLIVLIANSSDSTDRIATLIRSDFADGYLLFSINDDDSLLDLFDDVTRPVVLSELHSGAGDSFPTADFDNETAQRSITEYLIGKGHTGLAYVCGPRYSPSSLRRLSGFRAAMREHALPETVYYAEDWETRSGELAAMSILEHADHIDGVVCANDNIAIGAMNQLMKAGYRVPEDIAITGFDDSPIAAMIRPTLTTVHQDSALHGRLMATMLLTLMRGETLDERTVILPTTITERQSA